MYERGFKIQNFQSHAIAQVGLWLPYKPSLDLLFAYQASKSHILSIPLCSKFDGLFIFSPTRRRLAVARLQQHLLGLQWRREKSTLLLSDYIWLFYIIQFEMFFENQGQNDFVSLLF